MMRKPRLVKHRVLVVHGCATHMQCFLELMVSCMAAVTIVTVSTGICKPHAVACDTNSVRVLGATAVPHLDAKHTCFTCFMRTCVRQYTRNEFDVLATWGGTLHVQPHAYNTGIAHVPVDRPPTMCKVLNDVSSNGTPVLRA